jgi:hypothetical protein
MRFDPEPSEVVEARLALEEIGEHVEAMVQAIAIRFGKVGILRLVVTEELSKLLGTMPGHRLYTRTQCGLVEIVAEPVKPTQSFYTSRRTVLKREVEPTDALTWGEVNSGVVTLDGAREKADANSPHAFVRGKFDRGERGGQWPEETCDVCGRDPHNVIHKVKP